MEDLLLLVGDGLAIDKGIICCIFLQYLYVTLLRLRVIRDKGVIRLYA